MKWRNYILRFWMGVLIVVLAAGAVVGEENDGKLLIHQWIYRTI